MPAIAFSKRIRQSLVVRWLVGFSWPNGWFFCFGPTRRRNIDLIRKVAGTASIGAVKLTADGSPLNLEVIATSASNLLNPTHSGSRVLSQICGNDRRFSPNRLNWRRNMLSSFGETDRRDFARRCKLLRSHRPTQFVRPSPPDWCRHLDRASG